MSISSKVLDNSEMIKISDQYKRLKDKCYLDSTGAVLYPQKLLDLVREDLSNNIYMNPHSDKFTEECVENIRTLVLNHFKTDFTNYAIIFTSGATQSLKIVAETFKFSVDKNTNSKQGAFVYVRDNHTSVIGLREIAENKNAHVINIRHKDFLHAVNKPDYTNDKTESRNNTLFAYSALNNFNGFKYPINCLDDIRKGCLNKTIAQQWQKCYNWYIMLDAASYVGGNKLDLSKIQPDFVCISFYKIFGYPTGLGALLIKKTSVEVLDDKHYFGGGTVDMVLSSENFHAKTKDIQGRFEDGTVSFLSILALKHCFEVLHQIIPKKINDDIMETISHHVFYLAQDLYNQLITLQHKNETKAIVFYMDSDFTDKEKQGGIVTFNIVRDNGSYIGYTEFQHMANIFNINVRTGCFCNSGSCQRHFGRTNIEIKQAYDFGHTCTNGIDLLNGFPTGAIRASFSFYNTYKDVDRLIKMICRCFVNTKYVKPIRGMISDKVDVKVNKVKGEVITNGVPPLHNGLNKLMNGCCTILKTSNYT